MKAFNGSGSVELEHGKCGEYYTVFSLLKQGYSAFISDQGMAYDIVVDVGGELLRGQVKSTLSMRSYGKSLNVYRFGTRTGKGAERAAKTNRCDFYAFVAIEDEKIGFMAASELASERNAGTIKQTIEFRSETLIYPGRIYPTGKQRVLDFSRNIESFHNFNRVVEIIRGIKCQLKNIA